MSIALFALFLFLASCQSIPVESPSIMQAYRDGCQRAIASGYRTEWECREIIAVREKEFRAISRDNSGTFYMGVVPRNAPMLIINGSTGSGWTIMELP